MDTTDLPLLMNWHSYHRAVCSLCLSVLCEILTFLSLFGIEKGKQKKNIFQCFFQLLTVEQRQGGTAFFFFVRQGPGNYANAFLSSYFTIE